MASSNKITISDLKKQVLDNSKLFPEQTILAGFRGSIAHGTADLVNNSIDDVDLFSISVKSPEYYLGVDQFISGRKEQATVQVFDGRFDALQHEYLKAVSLLIKQNPNMLALLWTPNKYRLMISPMGKALVKMKKHFLSKQLYQTTLGYAKGQRSRMFSSTGSSAYMGEKRRALYEKFGYDCKYAAHAIRLLWCGATCLFTGEYPVELPAYKRKQVLNIKHGKFSVEQIQLLYINHLDALKESFEISFLPETIDYDIINTFVTKQMIKYISDGKY